MTEGQLAVLKEAKAGADLEMKIIPTRAVPGLHARVLGLGGPPPWVSDCALVSNPCDVDSVRHALIWMLTAPADDERGFMAKDWLEAVLGDEIAELPTPECKCRCGNKLAVRNYHPLNGCCEPCFEEGCYLVEGMCFCD
ncbi:hypothetical protein G7068_00105 [Leucobacter viscericola]|nr:hypothetical protein [Leucobacter viscericola]QIK61786.1 hypothetical protein G7068_00105 [Leucobacter viscericola]